jgi:hypothetical protein
MLGPNSIPFCERAEQFAVKGLVVLGGHEKSPELLIAARRSPTSGLEQTAEDFGKHRPLREGAGAPAVTEPFLDGVICRGGLLHDLPPSFISFPERRFGLIGG